jgi:hypothetical protein
MCLYFIHFAHFNWQCIMYNVHVWYMNMYKYTCDIHLTYLSQKVDIDTLYWFKKKKKKALGQITCFYIIISLWVIFEFH